MGIWKGILIGFGIVIVLAAIVFGGIEGYFYFQGKWLRGGGAAMRPKV
jgi:hypothetical protein